MGKEKNVSSKSKHHCEITERDYKLLRYLWKWKTMSTMALARKFFPDIMPMSAYRRLQFLETDKYIKATIVNGRHHEVWSIAERGFKYILPKLGELQHMGHKSENIYHDYLSTAFHLGEWLTAQPTQSQSYSEQQLRRYPMDVWPEWVPRSPNHRPDGYSVYVKNDKPVIIAFETELSPKTRDRYEGVVAYYDSQDAVQFVLWLVDSKPTVTAIRKSFEKFQVRALGKHHFVLLEDFQKLGWMAPVIHGQLGGKTINEILNRIGVVSASNSRPGQDVLALLDSRRRPITSSTCASAGTAQKPNRVSGHSPLIT